MRALNIFHIFCTFALFALLLTGCERAKSSADLESIETFVNVFHKYVTDMSFGKIYDETTIEFKRKTERDDFITGMSKVSSILGVPIETRFIGISDMKSDSGENLIASQYVTTYTHGSATETFIFRSLETQLQLFQYNINSDDLMKGLLASP